MKYKISIEKLNEKGFEYLQEVFPDFEGEDFDYLYAYLSYMDETDIIFTDCEQFSEFSLTIIRVMNDVNEDYNNLTLSYEEKKEEETEKTVLDIARLNEEGHDYLGELFNFSEDYGKNLDALYDSLSELPDTEVVVIHMDEVSSRSLKILSVFDEVAEEYGNIHMTYL
ncbi:MAG: barstar family protein [Erysipelotrichaceae bacterium]|nr:barstar family protein [Erysipelotrichaceae bacterium]